MKKLIYPTLLLTLVAIYSCNKECGTYEIKEDKTCITWASRINGNWEIIDHSVFPNAEGQIMEFSEMQANTLLIDGSLQAQMITENQYEIPEHTVQGPDGPYQYSAHGAYLQTPIYTPNYIPTLPDSTITGYEERLTFIAYNSSLPEEWVIVLKRAE